MTSFKLQKKLADSKIEIAMEAKKEDNDLLPLKEWLMGQSTFVLPVRDERGHLHHDCEMVLQSLYRYHQSHPNDQLDQLTGQAMIEIFQNSTHIFYVLNAARILQFHMFNEHYKKNAFELDCAAIYQELLNNIQRNKKVYSIYKENKEFDVIIGEIRRISSLKQ